MTQIELVKAILRAFERWAFAGLKHYGSLPTYPEQRAKMAAVYADVLINRKVRKETIGPAILAITEGEKDFPTAARFADACEEARRQMFRMIGREMVDANGHKFLATLEVRVDASVDECNGRMARVVKAFERHGATLPALPAPLSPERLQRIRATLSLPAPRTLETDDGTSHQPHGDQE